MARSRSWRHYGDIIETFLFGPFIHSYGIPARFEVVIIE
jgi:hypothetical protein